MSMYFSSRARQQPSTGVPCSVDPSGSKGVATTGSVELAGSQSRRFAVPKGVTFKPDVAGNEVSAKAGNMGVDLGCESACLFEPDFAPCPTTREEEDAQFQQAISLSLIAADPPTVNETVRGPSAHVLARHCTRPLRMQSLTVSIRACVAAACGQRADARRPVVLRHPR